MHHSGLNGGGAAAAAQRTPPGRPDKVNHFYIFIEENPFCRKSVGHIPLCYPLSLCWSWMVHCVVLFASSTAVRGGKLKSHAGVRWGMGSSQIGPSHARRDQQRRRRRHDRNEKRAVSDSSFYGPRPIVLPETGGGTTHSVGGPPVLPQRNVHGERARAVGVPNSKRRGSPLRNTYPINKC